MIRNVVGGGVQEVGGFADVLSRMVLRKAGVRPEEFRFVPIASADVPPLLAGALDTATLRVDQLILARRKEASLHPLVKFWELEPTVSKVSGVENKPFGSRRPWP